MELKIGDEVFYLVLGGAGLKDKIWKFYDRDGEAYLQTEKGVHRPVKEVQEGTCKDLFISVEAMREFANPLYNRIKGKL